MIVCLLPDIRVCGQLNHIVLFKMTFFCLVDNHFDLILKKKKKKKKEKPTLKKNKPFVCTIY